MYEDPPKIAVATGLSALSSAHGRPVTQPERIPSAGDIDHSCGYWMPVPSRWRRAAHPI